MADFTDEEGYGRYLDMHECYEKYINLKGVDVSLRTFTVSPHRLRALISQTKMNSWIDNTILAFTKCVF